MGSLHYFSTNNVIVDGFGSAHGLSLLLYMVSRGGGRLLLKAAVGEVVLFARLQGRKKKSIDQEGSLTAGGVVARC